MPVPVDLLLDGWTVAAIGLAVLWAIQLWTRDAGISDAGWTVAIGGLAVWYALVLDAGWAPRRWLVAGATAAWAFRLAGHLVVDRVLAGDEDARYRALRERWGERAWAGFFLVFQAQALLAVVFSAAPLLAMLHPESALRAWDVAGLVVVAVAVVGESAADRRLARFRADPANRGEVCDEGLWRYSRHPNYFFEWLHWWAYPVFAFGSRLGAWAVFAPALMYVFLTRLTGIPTSERRALESRGEAYRRYQERTSAFFPRPPAPAGD